MSIQTDELIELEERGIGLTCDVCGDVSDEDNTAEVTGQGYTVCEVCVPEGMDAEELGSWLNFERLRDKEEGR